MKRFTQLLLAAFFAIAGVLHFVLDDAFARIVPPVFPFPVAIVWLTGLVELAFAAALIMRFRVRATGWLLGLYLLAVLPANIYMALERIPLGATALPDGALWLRVSLQFPLIAIVLWACGSLRPNGQT